MTNACLAGIASLLPPIRHCSSLLLKRNTLQYTSKKNRFPQVSANDRVSSERKSDLGLLKSCPICRSSQITQEIPETPEGYHTFISVPFHSKACWNSIPHDSRTHSLHCQNYVKLAYEFPMLQSSTPIISNFSPSSLKGSFPNVRHALLIPLSKVSSSHNP
jgi:hypothetical protein